MEAALLRSRCSTRSCCVVWIVEIAQALAEFECNLALFLVCGNVFPLFSKLVFDQAASGLGLCLPSYQSNDRLSTDPPWSSKGQVIHESGLILICVEPSCFVNLQSLTLQDHANVNISVKHPPKLASKSLPRLTCRSTTHRTVVALPSTKRQPSRSDIIGFLVATSE
mgnify:CR=1 FL=1